VQGQNGAGKAGYIGMCPPSGVHHYHFYLYALITSWISVKKPTKPDLKKL